MSKIAVKNIVKPLHSGFGAIACSSFAIGEAALFSIGGVVRYPEGQIFLAATLPLLIGGAYLCGIDYIDGPGSKNDQGPVRNHNIKVDKTSSPKP